MNGGKKKVRIEFVFDAPVGQVWRAWTDAAIVLKWVGSDPRGRGLEAFAEARPGGQFAFSFQNADQTRFTAFGRYIEVDQPRHLSFTWEWINEPGVESTVDLSLVSVNDTTRMVFQHDGLDPASGHDYVYGWNSTFSKLNRILVVQTILDRFTRHFARQMGEAMNKDGDSEKEMHEDARSIFRNNGFIRKEVNELFASSEVAGATGKTRHPGLLYFNAVEWLQFAEMHLRHHFRQKKRIDEQLLISQ